jgi:hypothetical protein
MRVAPSGHRDVPFSLQIGYLFPRLLGGLYFMLAYKSHIN